MSLLLGVYLVLQLCDPTLDRLLMSMPRGLNPIESQSHAVKALARFMVEFRREVVSQQELTRGKLADVLAPVRNVIAKEMNKGARGCVAYLHRRLQGHFLVLEPCLDTTQLTIDFFEGGLDRELGTLRIVTLYARTIYFDAGRLAFIILCLLLRHELRTRLGVLDPPVQPTDTLCDRTPIVVGFAQFSFVLFAQGLLKALVVLLAFGLEAVHFVIDGRLVLLELCECGSCLLFGHKLESLVFLAHAALAAE